MLGLTFSSKLDWDSYIISIDKTASKKIGASVCSMKFLSPEKETVVMSGAMSCLLVATWNC